MADTWKTKLKDLGGATGKLAAASPETLRAFGGLAAAATKDGALDKKTKELMAIAISICIRCEGCIAYHTSNALKAGATRAEMIETINMAIEMGGGPSTVYGAKALEAFDEFSA
jgi:AhpD family alkylhydroperoxidase